MKLIGGQLVVLVHFERAQNINFSFRELPKTIFSIILVMLIFCSGAQKRRCLRDRIQKQMLRKRLFDKVVGASFNGLNSLPNFGMSRRHYNGNIFSFRQQMLKNIHAIPVRQLQLH